MFLYAAAHLGVRNKTVSFMGTPTLRAREEDDCRVRGSLIPGCALRLRRVQAPRLLRPDGRGVVIFGYSFGKFGGFVGLLAHARIDVDCTHFVTSDLENQIMKTPIATAPHHIRCSNSQLQQRESSLDGETTLPVFGRVSVSTVLPYL